MFKGTKKTKYRSGFEDKVLAKLDEVKLPYKYEPFRISYVSAHSYTPDLVLPNGIIVELKGRFTSSDRSKHLHIKKQNPDLQIRFVFQDAFKPLRKGSNTSYGMWADKNGFIWSNKSVPESWWREKT